MTYTEECQPAPAPVCRTVYETVCGHGGIASVINILGCLPVLATSCLYWASAVKADRTKYWKMVENKKHIKGTHN